MPTSMCSSDHTPLLLGLIQVNQQWYEDPCFSIVTLDFRQKLKSWITWSNTLFLVLIMLPYPLLVSVNVPNIEYCTEALSQDSYDAMVYAVQNHYWYQMYIGEFPPQGCH